MEKKVNIQNVLPRYLLSKNYLSDIEKSPNTNRQYLGQPDMIKTKTGRLITAYPIGHGKGPLVMKVSDDKGETWIEKTNIPSKFRHYRLNKRYSILLYHHPNQDNL